MKETGLMFKAPLVRSILDGSKTQTRRLLKLRPGFDFEEREVGRLWPWAEHPDRADDVWMPCPYGGPGDRIYVRETFVQGFNADPQTGDRLQWDADGNALPMTTWYRATDQIGWSDDDGWEANTPWKPAIHMPKALARIWLDITSVRVERLQDISRGDAMAEGCPFPNMANGPDPREWFAELWQSTGGDWAANPWVWVIDFKCDQAQGGQ